MSNQNWYQAALNECPLRNPSRWDVETGVSQQSWRPILLVVVYINWNLTYTTEQDSRVSWLSHTGFAGYGKELQLVSGFPYDETEQLFRLTSPSGI